MGAAEALSALALLGVAASLALLLGLVRVWRRRYLGLTLVCALGSLAAALLAALCGLILIGTQGYRALTREVMAARVRLVPDGDRAFVAHFRFPDGRDRVYRIRGDELYVDAHILKWKPLVNVLGLHTSYELDRVAGRYRLLEDEQTLERTVHSLKQPKPVDLFELRRRFALLDPLVDATYGSGTFVGPPRHESEWEIRVSTSGLLVRRADDDERLP